MAGCFGDSKEDQWKEKQTMGKDWDDTYPECEGCGKCVGENNRCVNKECEECDDYEEPEEEEEGSICSTCNGSGEGQYEGTHCQECGGGGEKLCKTCEYCDGYLPYRYKKMNLHKKCFQAAKADHEGRT